MKQLIKIFSFILVITIIMVANTYAQELPTRDDGRDKNGDLIIAKTLAFRCGISSQNPAITSDCIDRLAFDYKTGTIIDDKFENFADERKAILNEYAGSYIQKALEQLIASSSYEDKVNDMLCNDVTKPECMSLSKDIREEIEGNNSLAADNSAMMLDAIRLRSSQLNMDSVKNLLYNLVPERDVDLSNKSLAGPPE